MATTADDAGVAQAELIKKGERLLRTVLQAASDLQDVMLELQGKHAKRIPEKDEYGEPTWAYAVKRPVPEEIYVTRAFREYAAKYGFTPEQTEILMHGAPAGSGSSYEGFKKYYARMMGQPNGKWARWTLVWQKWIREQRERKKQKDAGRASRFDQQRTRV